MRYLGIDFGERRIGLAISDENGRIASPLQTIARRSDDQATREIGRIAELEGIGALVVGEPRRLDGAEGEAARRSTAFAERLSRTTGLPCHRIDEALTSVEAMARMREAGLDPRRDRPRLDAFAAQVLLQDFLDSRRDGE